MSDLYEILGIDRNEPETQLAIQLNQAEVDLMYALVAAREAAGLSQADVAKRMDVKVKKVRNFERTAGDPRLSTLRRYALAVGVCIDHTVRPAHQD